MLIGLGVLASSCSEGSFSTTPRPLKVMVDNAWSDIDVSSAAHDLIPNLVET